MKPFNRGPDWSTIIVFIFVFLSSTVPLEASEENDFSECVIKRSTGGGNFKYPFRSYAENYVSDFFDKCGGPVSCYASYSGDVSTSLSEAEYQECLSCGHLTDEELLQDDYEVASAVKAQLYNYSFHESTCSASCATLYSQINELCFTSCSSECKEATLNLIHQKCYWRFMANMGSWHSAWITKIKEECLSANWTALMVLMICAVFGSILLLVASGFIMTFVSKKLKRS